jgi:hypothetical protein
METVAMVEWEGRVVQEVLVVLGEVVVVVEVAAILMVPQHTTLVEVVECLGLVDGEGIMVLRGQMD